MGWPNLLKNLVAAAALAVVAVAVLWVSGSRGGREARRQTRGKGRKGGQNQDARPVGDRGIDTKIAVFHRIGAGRRRCGGRLDERRRPRRPPRRTN